MKNMILTENEILQFADAFPMSYELLQQLLELALKHPDKFKINERHAFENCLKLIKPQHE